MRVLSKEELKNEPIGTLYIPFIQNVFTGEPCIITGKDEDIEGWLGELHLLPFLQERNKNKYLTNWSTVDNAWNDLDEKQMYAVFSKDEIIKIIGCLQWALTGCETYFNQDEWWNE